MTDTPKYESTASGNTLILTRRLAAPRERVWAAWTEADQLAGWWGPEGFSSRVDQLDLRPGGQWRFAMIGPDGTEYPAKGVYQEIDPGKRIVSSDEFDEGLQEVLDIELPGTIRMTVDFAGEGTGTLLTITLEHVSEADRHKHEAMGVIDGWGSSLDCLEAYLT
ncbi:MAG: SRPBCC domain-containing protein [Verrucomicrobia bacterium]|nr:SRPBCC domain-containing protein [Verrucomicrobiota bacterium]MCH8514179.1 SRPBCC domain-containing protein [Kiritimatiellia bacterium]